MKTNHGQFKLLLLCDLKQGLVILLYREHQEDNDKGKQTLKEIWMAQWKKPIVL